MKITQKYLFALLLAAFAAPMVAEEQDEDVVRAAPTVTLNLLKDYVANVTGKGYNAASMNNVALYELAKSGDSTALASLVNSSTVGNVTLGSLVNSSTVGNVTLGSLVGYMQSYAYLTGTAFNNIAAGSTINPSGLVTTSTGTITFTVAGTYMITGSFVGATSTATADVTLQEVLTLNSVGANTNYSTVTLNNTDTNIAVSFPYCKIITVPATGTNTLAFNANTTDWGPSSIQLTITRLA